MTHTHKRPYLEAIDTLVRWYRKEPGVNLAKPGSCPLCPQFSGRATNLIGCPLCPWKLFGWHGNHECLGAGMDRLDRLPDVCKDSLARLASWRKRIEEW